MKILLNILLSIGLVICEVPPPYPTRGFRPNQPFNLVPSSNINQISQPQITYGVPNQNPSNPSLPPVPQTQYGPPKNQNISPLHVEVLSLLRTLQQNGIPQLSQNQNSNSKQTLIPSTSYGVPAFGSTYQLPTNTRSNQNNLRIINNQPQTANIAPSNVNNNINSPQRQYGAPDSRNIETLERIRQLNVLQNALLSKQNQLAADLASSQISSINNNVPTNQYLPAKLAANFRPRFEQQRPITNRPNNFAQSNIQQNPQYVSQNSLQQPPTNINNVGVAQSQLSNTNIEQPNTQYLPVKEATNFRTPQDTLQTNIADAGFDLIDFRNSGQSVQQPTDQYIPAKQPTNFGNVAQIPQRNQIGVVTPTPFVPPSQFNNPQNTIQNTNFPPQPITNRPNNFAQSNIQQNPQYVPQNSLQQPPTNINANLEFTNANNFATGRPQSNIDIQQANVRKLNPSGVNVDDSRVQSIETAGRNIGQVQPNVDFRKSAQQVITPRPIEGTYLVPTTTVRTIYSQPTRPIVSTPKPRVPVENEYDDEQSPESEEDAGGPNIAVSTAVAGLPGGRNFYLLQPDGRLQKVVYQKTQEQGDQENEYTANYLFQNIEADPNVVYAPLITLGK